MKLNTFIGAAIVAGGLLTAAGAAQAQVYVIDTPSAYRCTAAATAPVFNERGLADCDLALRADELQGRNLAGTYTNRGVLRLRAGQADAAMSDFDMALAIDNRLGEAWVDRAMGLIQMSRFQEAVGDADRGLPLVRRDQAKGYYVRAIAREGLRDDQGAYRDYSAAARMAPTWDAPRTDLARFEVRPR